MSNLSAPSIDEPLYECAKSVYVRGYVPGANVTIFAKPPGGGPTVQIGGGVSNSANGQIFGVTQSQIVRGARLTAIQVYGGSESPASAPLTVQNALSVDAPVLDGPLYACARCVDVDGLLPGVNLEVRDSGITIGQGVVPVSSVEMSLGPVLVAGHTITARQVYCGTPGPDSPGITVLSRDPKIPLPAPEVTHPLFACQAECRVTGCTPGSQAELFVNGVPTAAACASGATVDIPVPGGLLEGSVITARLTRCGNIQGPVSAPVVVQSAEDIPRPAICPPLYQGDTSVLVAMTVNGETVTIAADNTQIGMGGSGGDIALLNVHPPLVAGQQVIATVQLCTAQKQSLPAYVLPPPLEVPPPVLVEPLNACSLIVSVVLCLPGAKVRVYARSGGHRVLLGLGIALETSLVVHVTPPLKVGWSIFATQTVGAVTSDHSASAAVVPPGNVPPPVFENPVFACSRCVRLAGLIVGALVDVYQDNIWVGGIEASTPIDSVPVYPGLALDSTITATQTVCGKPGQAGEAKVVRGPDKVPTPELLPAVANQFHVGATGLTPGAIVEVEEISAYHMVIGSTCAISGGQNVELDLPLFTGAQLRARQILCDTGQYSPVIVVSPPPEWPLGPGPYQAGFRLVTVPASQRLVDDYTECPDGTAYEFIAPVSNPAIIYYPATAEGQDQPVAGGAPFPIMAYAHGRRRPSCLPGWAACSGTPTDTAGDYRQLSGLLAHLARWGFVSISMDLHWLALGFGFQDWEPSIADAANYLIAENSSANSPFHNRLDAAAISLMGHSTGGAAVIALGTNAQLPVAALGLFAPAGGSNLISSFAPKPMMILHGTLDTGPYGDAGQSLNIYAAAGPEKYFVSIEGANHFGYSDALCVVSDPAATISQADQQTIAKAYLTAFFRRYLQGAFEVEDYLTGVRPIEELEMFGIHVSSQV